MPPAHPHTMDKRLFPTPGGSTLSLTVAGDAWSWRLTTPQGGHVSGLAPDRVAARRSAAFAACAVEALHRIRQRRF